MGAVVSHLAIDSVKDYERGGSDCETACSLANNLSIASRYPRQLFFYYPSAIIMYYHHSAGRESDVDTQLCEHENETM